VGTTSAGNSGSTTVPADITTVSSGSVLVVGTASQAAGGPYPDYPPVKITHRPAGAGTLGRRQKRTMVPFCEARFGRAASLRPVAVEPGEGRFNAWAGPATALAPPSLAVRCVGAGVASLLQGYIVTLIGLCLVRPAITAVLARGREADDRAIASSPAQQAPQSGDHGDRPYRHREIERDFYIFHGTTVIPNEAHVPQFDTDQVCRAIARSSAIGLVRCL
jgi:hypothetical protein